jgi:ATP-dependent DNA helicase RecQ
MKVLSMADLRTADRRLDRRLESGQISRDVLPMIRSVLVARGYRSADLREQELGGLALSVLTQHGLRRVDGGWKADPWLPAWLDHSAAGVDEPAAKRAERQSTWAVAGDDFYRKVSGFDTEKTPGQRAAVRSAAVAGPGDTLLCVLPTGSGKTDVVLVRTLRARPQQALLVVPTVSLALDLERRVRELTGTELRFAYHGGLRNDVKEYFRKDLSSGAQWLTITSPEAACTVLAGPLEQSARAGRLDVIAVDEAHIVAEWGDDFRPAFHAFAGLRRRLVEMAPPGRAATTILLSGTLDSYGYGTLRRLFSGERFLFVTSQSTRPEPAWWSAWCADEEEKRVRLLEAVHHLPRPLLIYTSLHTSTMSTTTRDAQDWLRSAGYTAVTVVDGLVDARRRSAAVTGLRLAGPPNEDLDVVIATSAFGLGVDIPDIRAVIHLCVPESVDRLYQEVGRSGRDGRSTVSLVLWTEQDAAVARQMSEARLIGPDKAWKRWSRMLLGPRKDGRLTVDLTASHDEVKYPSSEANRYWNSHTLGAMDRAGMIRLHWPERPDIAGDATEDDLREAFDRYRSSAMVEVLQGDLGTEAVFRERFVRGRLMATGAASASLASACDLISGLSECSNVYLARHYRVLDGAGNAYPVTIQCGGCPDCRAKGRGLRLVREPVEPMIDGSIRVAPDSILDSAAERGRLCVWTNDASLAAEQALVDRLIRHGVVALVSTQAWSPRPSKAARDRVWWPERVPEWLRWDGGPWRVPTLLRVDDSLTDELLARALDQLARQSLGIVLTTRDRLDPNNPKQALREGWLPSYFIDDLLRRI